MRILIFGKTGQVATELQLQADVVALGRDSADLSDPAACAAVIAASDCDVVINAAAYTAVDRAEQEEAVAHVINGDAPTAMAHACAARGTPFIHISTDYVFAGTGTDPWRVSDPVAPQNAYGRTKLAGEEGVRAAGGQSAILRTSWVFSAHGNNFVKTMLRLSQTRDALSVVADQIGGPTPAADIAKAALSMAQQMLSDPNKGGTHHFGGTPAVSWADFATEIFTQANRAVTVSGIPTADYPTPACRPLNSRMDGTTLETDFNIAQPDWKTGLGCVLKTLEHTI
ncbi:dTDP-4-dehydrorhamnose reductase [Sulfitobacter donghicola]|uniref:dTDP-4-dehydrorhamnose reductase n=1 Tax=Sulfitobacter donghicola DSW-25 = KCTC 12864 = JCM 14565 TaxID=1300350 RepID=A0A073IDC9_9RHOB|nr:dTDP-4-dehydrorhamnose reductase [Sulfitobacter donghicola]KEJ87749.1 dTDP-4-dehydrorhamnose reductase [Sulfitobacter donghicola DSW-25 = KCTC 12864 = JCM 14565]KIN70383.1 dTDP-4-dehydrorhamnose reductase [Sulfitobacter donghicola DSW-25 = KCTC 12864 = JCM 14565]